MTNEEYRRSRRAVVVPTFMKRKLFLVFILLVASAVMVGLATYAWFILSTAPEIRGVSTVVGANGSLEMALLNEETGANLTKISAKVGDSIYEQGIVKGNVTWGNLVDLSDPSYGLNTLVLNPSILNKDGDKLNTTAMLSVAKNGLDGRITRLDSNTVAARYDGTGFTGGASYGVRVVGTTGNGSGGSSRASLLSQNKNAFTSNISKAEETATTALATYGKKLMDVVTASTLSYADVEAVRNLTAEYQKSLNYIYSSYLNAIIVATAGDKNVSDADFETIRKGVNAVTPESNNTISQYANRFPSGLTLSGINTVANDIISAQQAIGRANALLEAEKSSYTVDEVKTAVMTTLVSNLSESDLDGTDLTLRSSTHSGLFTEVARYVGDYELSIGVFSLSVETTEQSGNGLLSVVDLSGYSAPESVATTTNTTAGSSVLTNFYGYVIDLAFRTNVAANLKLESVPVDRIYTDGAGATAGGGSYMKLTVSDGVKMTAAQIKSLFSAVRVVFFDHDAGTIYGTAKLEVPNVADDSKSATAKLFMIDQDGNLAGNGAAIMPLETATPKKLSVLVYFDGKELNNISVVNAATSGTMTMNLQFGSTADLKPMEDNSIKTATEADAAAANAAIPGSVATPTPTEAPADGG